MNLEQFVTENGGIYADLSDYYTHVREERPRYDNGETTENMLTYFRELQTLWAGNATLTAEVSRRMEEVTTINRVLLRNENVIKLDDYGWTEHSRVYGLGVPMLVAGDALVVATILRKFYTDDTFGMIVIRQPKWLVGNVFSGNAISRLLPALQAGYIPVRSYDMAVKEQHEDMLEAGGFYHCFFTSPKAYVQYLIDFPYMTGISSMPHYGMEMPQWFNRTKDTFAMRISTELTARLNDRSVLPPAHSETVAAIKRNLRVPGKLKKSPIDFARTVFEAFGYVMDLNGISYDAKYPKLAKVIENIPPWNGTGVMCAEVIKAIIEHCGSIQEQ